MATRASTLRSYMGGETTTSSPTVPARSEPLVTGAGRLRRAARHLIAPQVAIRLMLTLTQTVEKISSRDGQQEASRLSTLWDVAKEFEYLYSLICRELTQQIEQWIVENESDNSVIPTESKEALFGLDLIEDAAKKFELERTVYRLSRFRRTVEEAQTYSNLALLSGFEMRELRAAFEDDLSERFLLILERAKAPYWRQRELCGPEVFAKFRSIRADVMAAGSCYATENNTACVFHLMRATEALIRTLAKHLEVILPHEIEYADWKAIKDAIDAKLTKLRNTDRGTLRETEIDFYANAAERCQYFKELWRDKIMHSRVSCTEHKALDVLTRFKDFAQLLAQRLSE